MNQVNGKTILSMEFKSIIKAHDLNQWQFIHPKPNSYWQHQSPIFIGTTLSKREKVQDYECLAKKNIMVKCYRGKKGSWQSSYEKTH